MGVARLTKVTLISPRSDYPEVARTLAQFKEFHPLESKAPNFDPGVQELAVRAVRLFSQADQAVKDLALNVEPGWMDQVFRGVKIERTSFDATEWGYLLARAERELEPIAQEVKALKNALQKAVKDEADAQTLSDALRAVSGFSADIAGLRSLNRFRVVLCVVGRQTGSELRNSLPDSIFVSQSLNEEEEIVLVAVKASESNSLDRAIKALEIKPLSIPPNFPQNPAEAFKKLRQDYESAQSKEVETEASLAEAGRSSGSRLLAVRELSGVARDLLDDVRVSGDMKRLATISGYIPAKHEEQFRNQFRKWIFHLEPVVHEPETPVLFENRRGIGLWQLVTREQGIPGKEEVDPTPLISFVFPIFFGLMFGDFGHGLIFTLFVLFVRQRTSGIKRQWANVFLVTGFSSMFFGIVFGEFFGFSLYGFLPIPPVIEIIDRTGATPRPDIGNVEAVMIVSILIGMAHLTTGLGLDIYEGLKAGERLDVLIDRLPALTMYVSGLGYGIAFVGAGFKFDVLSTSVTAPLVGIPVNALGGLSLAVLLPSMLVLFAGRAVAVKLGRLQGISFVGALSNGGLEVFEKVLQFLSNTISYVRLAVMLLVHAVLLMIVNYLPLSNPIYIAPWVILNLLVLALEGLIVYVQDLRLHVYEFFTKFYAGTGKPFRKILPDRARISINWL